MTTVSEKLLDANDDETTTTLNLVYESLEARLTLLKTIEVSQTIQPQFVLCFPPNSQATKVQDIVMLIDFSRNFQSLTKKFLSEQPPPLASRLLFSYACVQQKFQLAS